MQIAIVPHPALREAHIHCLARALGSHLSIVERHRGPGLQNGHIRVGVSSSQLHAHSKFFEQVRNTTVTLNIFGLAPVAAISQLKWSVSCSLIRYDKITCAKHAHISSRQWRGMLTGGIDCRVASGTSGVMTGVKHIVPVLIPFIFPTTGTHTLTQLTRR